MLIPDRALMAPLYHTMARIYPKMAQLYPTMAQKILQRPPLYPTIELYQELTLLFSIP